MACALVSLSKRCKGLVKDNSLSADGRDIVPNHGTGVVHEF